MINETKSNKRENGGAEKMKQRAHVAPVVDIFENKDEVLIVADLPGVEKEGLSIHFENNHLTIEGARGRAAKANASSEERRADSFDEEPFDYVRTFVVPGGVDAEKISAELNLGVLRLKLPKPAALKPRQIPITAS